MGKKQLIVNLVSNIIAFGTSLLISFVLTPYLISNVGKEAYAFYPISNNFVSYMAIIATALNSMTSRFITIEVVNRNWNKAYSYFSSAFFANLILAGIFAIPMALIVKYLDVFMNIPATTMYDVKILFILVFLSMIINMITTVFGISTFVSNRMELKAGSDIFQGLMKAFLFILLFTLFEPSIIFLGLVVFVLSVINFIIQFIYTKKLLPSFKISYTQFDFKIIKELISAGVWNSINSLGSVLLMGFALLFSNIFIGASAAGDLAIAQTLPNFMTTIICAVYAVFLPRITQVYAQGNKIELINEVKLSQKILGLVATVPAILVVIFGTDFFKLWVPGQDAKYLQILSIISIIPLIVHSNMWTIYGLTVTANKLRTPSLVLIGSGGINILVIYLLLSNVNVGLITVLIINNSINILYYLFFIPIYISKQFNIKIFTFYAHICKAIVFTLFFLVIGFELKQNIDINTWYDFFMWGGIFGVLGLVLNAIFILERKDFKEIKNVAIKVRKTNKNSTQD